MPRQPAMWDATRCPSHGTSRGADRRVASSKGVGSPLRTSSNWSMTTITRVGRWCAAITVTEVLAFLDMTNGAHAREDVVGATITPIGRRVGSSGAWWRTRESL